jgi:hypothetical protein
MKRREFTKCFSVVAISAPVLALAKTVEVAKEKNKPLEPLGAGDILTANYLRQIADRINQLEERG